MNRFVTAYHNFVNNDLAICKKAANGMGIFFLIVNAFQSISYFDRMPFIFWIIVTLASLGMGFIVGYITGIIPTSVVYYLMEVVSPRKEKSYLPNETKEE